MPAPMTNALSVDVEEYFQVSAFETVIPREHWPRWPTRVEAQTDALLALFEDNGVKATFFTLGWIAEHHPDLVRRIVGAGHELACHGYEHIRATALDREGFRHDTERSKALLEDVSGTPVVGYRAASFSIASTNLWAFEVLEEMGFHYSSSIYPVRHDHYGLPRAPRTPFTAPGTQRLTEIPVTTVRLGGRNIPAGGGGYFRLFPYALSRALIRRVNRGEGVAANMYFHPWEFDPAQPRPRGLGPRTRFRHYLNQGVALARLARLLQDFAWAPFREVYAAVLEGRCAGVSRSELRADH